MSKPYNENADEMLYKAHRWFFQELEASYAAIAIHFFPYNFIGIHETIRVTPAMRAGISKHLISWKGFLTFHN